MRCLQAPNAKFARRTNVKWVCWIEPGDFLQYGGFLYLWGDEPQDQDPRDCIFEVAGVSEERHAILNSSAAAASELGQGANLRVSRHVASTATAETKGGGDLGRTTSSLTTAFPESLGPLRLLPVTLQSAGKGLKVKIDVKDHECAHTHTR